MAFIKIQHFNEIWTYLFLAGINLDVVCHELRQWKLQVKLKTETDEMNENAPMKT